MVYNLRGIILNIKLYENNIVEIIDNNVIIKEPKDILELYFVNKCSTIILKKENIINDFYNLSTGIAGEILQKLSNYNKRMAIIGNFVNIKSKSLKDFIYESNKTRQIIFINTLEEAIKIFSQ